MVDFLAATILLGLATFGATYLVFYTEGPWDLFSVVRRRLTTVRQPVYDDDGKEVDIVEEPRKFFADMLSCFWCSSFWVALIIVGSYYIASAGPYGGFPFSFLAAIGIAGYLHERIANG